MSICQIDSCTKPTIARGWCHKHYKRWQIHGDPEALLVPQEFHGQAKSPEYRIWTHLKGRCNNPKDARYADYGGRGIKVKFDSFSDFIKEVGLRPSSDLTIDRIDNNKGYEPGNIRWATVSEQNSNKRLYKNSTSGHRGIDAFGKLWRARIYRNKKTISVGYFPTIEEAIKARESRIQHG